MKEYILEVKKIIPTSLCKKIIQYFDNNYEDARTVGGINKNTRNCLSRDIVETQTFGQKLCFNAVREKIFDCVEHYKRIHKVEPERISQLDLLKYEANEYKAGYNFHVDFGPQANERHLSISICLNNDYTGGEFVFDLPDGHRYNLPQNEGDAVIFPSNFMFRHQVNKVISGTRYALISWVI